MAPQNYALKCDDENGVVLSNWRGIESWQALEKLIGFLLEHSNFSNYQNLYGWKQGHHLAQAKEPYAWRAALEEIKNSDLSVMCSNLKDREEATLISDKPTMLKISGEIANSLMHSYTARHHVSFIQRVSNVPS